jgi:hypothetical protein
VDAAKWRAALPEDAWPREFPVDGLVWRQDVFAVAERWRDNRATARQLLAATLMWYYGAAPHGRRRALRTLGGDPSGARIEAVLLDLRKERPTPADLRNSYIAFRTGCRLPYFDPDFATRLVYFAGYRRGAGGTQPLILDEEIALRLPASAGITNSASRGSSMEWFRYIAWAAVKAEADGVEPDRVEMDLSAGGGRYGRVRREPAPVRGRHARR